MSAHSSSSPLVLHSMSLETGVSSDDNYLNMKIIDHGTEITLPRLHLPYRTVTVLLGDLDPADNRIDKLSTSPLIYRICFTNGRVIYDFGTNRATIIDNEDREIQIINDMGGFHVRANPSWPYQSNTTGSAGSSGVAGAGGGGGDFTVECYPGSWATAAGTAVREGERPPTGAEMIEAIRTGILSGEEYGSWVNFGLFGTSPVSNQANPVAQETTFTPQEKKEPPIDFTSIYPDLECAGCNSRIDQPENLQSFLGNDETIKYVDYCKETGQQPALYCCHCFRKIKTDSDTFNLYKQMLGRYRSMRTAEEKIEKDMQVVAEQKKELTKQLLEVHDKNMKEVNDFKKQVIQSKHTLQSELANKEALMRAMEWKAEQEKAEIAKQLTKERIKNMLFDINPLARLLKMKVFDEGEYCDD